VTVIASVKRLQAAFHSAKRPQNRNFTPGRTLLHVARRTVAKADLILSDFFPVPLTYRRQRGICPGQLALLKRCEVNAVRDHSSKCYHNGPCRGPAAFTAGVFEVFSRH
jgi:hypothetical protein